MPLLLIGLFGWALDLTTAQTVMLQAAFAMLAMVGSTIGASLNEEGC